MNRCIVLIVLAAAVGCCPARKAVAPSVQDSVRVETQIRTEYIRDTVLVEVPVEEKEQTVRDTVSRLETSFAVSEAEITTDGALRHSLENKPQRRPVPAETKVVYCDSIVYRDRIETERVEVERELTWWQQTRMKGFWVLLAVALWLLRKPVAALLRRLV